MKQFQLAVIAPPVHFGTGIVVLSKVVFLYKISFLHFHTQVSVWSCHGVTLTQRKGRNVIFKRLNLKDALLLFLTQTVEALALYKVQKMFFDKAKTVDFIFHAFLDIMLNVPLCKL